MTALRSLAVRISGAVGGRHRSGARSGRMGWHARLR